MDNLVNFTDTKAKFPKSWNQTKAIYTEEMYACPHDRCFFNSRKATSRSVFEISIL